MKLLHYDGNADAFVAYKEESGRTIPPLPAGPDAVTWWHASTTGPNERSAVQSAVTVPGRKIALQSLPEVTHVGPRSAAENLALHSQQFKDRAFDGLFRIDLPPNLKVLPEAYVENFGQRQMREFESMLLNSGCDLAYTLNNKEAENEWTAIITREALGNIYGTPGPGVTIEREPWTPPPFDLYKFVSRGTQ
ncbi:hypothetical protein [Paenarthrobacter ilicis]|uniref:hypothetical protein n=1 Tax=Paenarthrobacter ilicis TaxID=43665 RepID=UPI0028D59DE5|nr:hypothetical protein [Paenarthrobacter ilicis]